MLCASGCILLFHYPKQKNNLYKKKNKPWQFKHFKKILNAFNFHFVYNYIFLFFLNTPALQSRCKGYVFATTVLPGEHT